MYRRVRVLGHTYVAGLGNLWFLLMFFPLSAEQPIAGWCPLLSLGVCHIYLLIVLYIWVAQLPLAHWYQTHTSTLQPSGSTYFDLFALRVLPSRFCARNWA